MATEKQVLAGVKAGDAVIVTRNAGWNGNTLRKIREVDYVAKVYRHVLQTCYGLTGVEISTGRTVSPFYGSVYVTPATDAKVAEVLREIEERKKAEEGREDHVQPQAGGVGSSMSGVIWQTPSGEIGPEIGRQRINGEVVVAVLLPQPEHMAGWHARMVYVPLPDLVEVPNELTRYGGARGGRG